MNVKLESINYAKSHTIVDIPLPTENWLKISVKDTGIGIPKKQQQIIFEAFQQGDGATVQKYGGTGLGLSICKKLCDMLNGYIFVESEVGKGSTFTVYLPRLQEEDINNINLEMQYSEVVKQVATTIETGESEGDNVSDILYGKKVLITDDDQRNIYSLRAVLEKQGMEVLEAHNGIKCLDMLNKGVKIDMILMDIMMPEMNGYEAMKRIRQSPDYASLPIIALTAKAMKGDREKCLAAGASDYISKPINLEQLISVMRVWLN